MKTINGIKGFKILKHDYQRNGISGEGFYIFEIEFKDDFGQKRKAIATLTNDQDIDGNLFYKKFNASCRVVTPDNLEDHWRGDEFEYVIRKTWKNWKYKRSTDPDQ